MSTYFNLLSSSSQSLNNDLFSRYKIKCFKFILILNHMQDYIATEFQTLINCIAGSPNRRNDGIF